MRSRGRMIAAGQMGSCVCGGKALASGGDEAWWGYTMRVICVDAARGVIQTRWDHAGAVRGWRGRRWFVVVVAYVGVHVYVRTPHCKLPQQRGAISDLGGDRTEGVLVR